MKRLNTYMQAESTAAALDKAAAVLVWKLENILKCCKNVYEYFDQ